MKNQTVDVPFIKNGMLRHPLATVTDREGTSLFEEILTESERLAEKLAGISCAALLCRSERQELIALLACLSVSVTALPLSGDLSANEAALAAGRPSHIVTETKGVLTVLSYGKPDNRWDSVTPRPAVLLPDEEGGLLAVSEESLEAVIRECLAGGLCQEDRLLVRSLSEGLLPLAERLAALRCGASLMLLPRTPHPQTVLDSLRRGRITAMSGRASQLLMLLRPAWRLPPTLHRVAVDGEAMPSVMAVLTGGFPAVTAIAPFTLPRYQQPLR